MSRLPIESRERLWQIIASKPQEQALIEEAILLIEKSGAYNACHQQATRIIQSAWRKLDPHVRDSFIKVMLRAFSWYVLDREF